ncbi:MAG: Fic family protein [Chlamydiales bacterium]|nr:Fic family protein [Chlamydiia bacterium]MCP5508254.1 Fic family protein [Chlamydiales bacterium]
MPVFVSDKPFNDLPLLPPKANLESPVILKACIEANKELAQLKMAERLIPNQTVLINSIPLLESQASSAIENIVTTTDDLFKYADSKSINLSPALKETFRYRTALREGISRIAERPITVSTVCKVCSTIREIETDIRKIPGTTLVNDLTSEQIYTPPSGEDTLRNLLTNWQQFLYEEDGHDPLIKLAIQHYQFEAIHPFADGNGRTGRIINLLYLVDCGLLDSPVLYLSRFIIKRKSVYYEKLLDVTKNQNWESWILYFLEGIRETSQWTKRKILAIQELIDDTALLIQKEAPRIYRKELVELLFTQPYVRISNITQHRIAERQTASKYLHSLCSLGVIDELRVGREKVFINNRFLKLLRAN